MVLVVPPRIGRPQAVSGEGGGQSPPSSPRREFESGHCGDLIFSVFLARLNFSLFGQRKVTKEIPLRRGRFRFLPLLRISLIETAKGARGPPLDSPGSGGKLVQNLTACTMQRQAKRLRAETGATAYSTIAPDFGNKQDIRGDRLNACQRETRVQAPFSLWAESAAAACGR